MLTTRLWVSFAIWEAIAGMSASLLAYEFTPGGGGFNQSLFLGTIAGATGLWWSLVLLGTGLIGYAKMR